MDQQSGVSHGAHLVARTSFGTVVLVSLALFIGGLSTGQPLSIYLALVVGSAGASFGYWLWKQGHHLRATALHTSGLLGSALMCLAATETLGGPTAVLMLASVITAGGLAGRRGAIASVLAVGLMCVIGYTWPAEIRRFFGLAETVFVVPEIMVAVFVITSVPSWAAYVVAVDASNRSAWLKAEATAVELAETNARLAAANQELQLRQANLQRAMEQQAAVTRLGVFTTGAPSSEQVSDRAARLLTQLGGSPELSKLLHGDPDTEQRVFSQIAPENRSFAKSVLKLVRAHASRTAEPTPFESATSPGEARHP